MEQLLLERMLQQLACRGEGALLGRASGQAPPHLLTMASPTHYGVTYSPWPHLLTMAPLTLQMLDELLADTLCRHALRLSRRQSRVSESRVLGAAHRQLANRAMLDELLTQLQVDPKP